MHACLGKEIKSSLGAGCRKMGGIRSAFALAAETRLTCRRGARLVRTVAKRARRALPERIANLSA
mgnify:CR=1 FL=1